MTHYATLGVSETANQEEIKRAYRKLASQHHPDKGGDTKRFQEIQTAYNTLSDANRRQQYDHERTNPGGVRFSFNGNPMGGMPPEMNDIFKNFGFNFNVGGDPFGRPAQRRNRDIRIEIAIPLVETLEVQNKNVMITTSNGSSPMQVQIPRGVSDGTQIKYSELGDNLFNTLPRGDLYVIVRVIPQENMYVQNLDLYTKVSVNCLHAITGTEVAVKTVSGKELLLTIPAGTQPKTKFRVAQQGLYQINAEYRGDLYVELEVTIPQNLTADQVDTIRKISQPQ
jgi:curved DNA-binding protein